MKKLNKKQKTIIFVLAFLLITPVVVFYILDKNGTFDTRSSADTSLTGEFPKADLNDDEKITIEDFSIWLVEYRAFKANSNGSSTTLIGDLDEDGSVKISDFAMWLRLWRAYKGTGLDGDLCGSGENCKSGICTVLYRDSDGDGYGGESSSTVEGDLVTTVIGSARIGICGASATQEGYVPNNQDCDDTRKDIHPGSTACLKKDTQRTDGSYDSNCDGNWDKCDGVTCEKGEECVSEVCTEFSKIDDGSRTIKACGTTPPAGYQECTYTTFYKDADGDGYGTASSSIKSCTTEAPSGYVSNDDDCYDSNKNAKPGQTACFTTNRGDGSFDYNCNGKQDKCISCYKIGASGTNNMYCGIGGRCVETTEPATSVTLLSCGVSGNEAVKITCYNQPGCTQRRPTTYYEGGNKCTMSCN